MIRKPIKAVATETEKEKAKKLFESFMFNTKTCRGSDNAEIKACLKKLKDELISDFEVNENFLLDENELKKFNNNLDDLVTHLALTLDSDTKKNKKKKQKEKATGNETNIYELLDKIQNIIKDIKKIKTKDSPNFGKEFAKAFKSNFKKQLKYIKKKNKK